MSRDSIKIVTEAKQDNYYEGDPYDLKHCFLTRDDLADAASYAVDYSAVYNPGVLKALSENMFGKISGSSISNSTNKLDSSLIGNNTISNSKINNKPEVNEMKNTARRVVTVEVLDLDAGVPVEECLVYVFENIVTEDSDEILIRELIMNGDGYNTMSEILHRHNEKRVELTNKEILNRIGVEVKLEPVKLKDLTIRIK